MNKQKVALVLGLAMTTSTIGNSLLLSNDCEQRLVGEIEQRTELKLDTEKPFDKLMRDAENSKRLMEEKERKRIEEEKRLAEERRKVEEEKKRSSVISRGDSIEYQEINIICSAYTSDPAENGNSLGITASGKKLQEGFCAIPRNYKLGTKVVVFGLEKYTGFNKLVGYDYGNPSYIRQIDSNTIKIDVYMSSKKQAINFGVRKFKGYIVK